MTRMQQQLERLVSQGSWRPSPLPILDAPPPDPSASATPDVQQRPAEPPPEQTGSEGAPASATQSSAPIAECKICLCPLAEHPCEALLCGHTFHTRCIDQFVQATGRTRENGCSFKCQLQASTVEATARENSLVTAANEAAMRAAAAAVDTSTTTIDDDEYTEEGVNLT